MQLDWEGLRTFAHVCQTGNMSAAARELGVNQTTVARRIARLEEWVGYSVLYRDGRSVGPTPRAQNLLETAQSMQRTVTGLLENEPASDRNNKEISGIVRVTSVDAILENCVAPHLARLQQDYPKLSLELIGANRNLSLPNRETDIAIRLARPESGAFHIKLLGKLESAVYCNLMGGDENRLDPASMSWIDLDDFFADKPEQRWLAQTFPGRKTIGYANRMSIIVSMMEGRACCALLPVCVGDACSGLKRIDGYEPDGREVWLLTHQDKRHLPQVRAVADWLTDILPDGEAITRL
ncbi:MAG: LysR family transcriptional regulator [Thalassospira sp.]|uniref:LysR family transcriptional regulator n=1 Tax=Thalassospira sp. TaxID=1912094 RepID=UPI0032EACDF2